MNRDELLKVLYANWMDNDRIRNREIKSLENELMNKFKELNPKMSSNEYLEVEDTLNQLTDLYLMEGFKKGFTIAMTLTGR